MPSKAHVADARRRHGKKPSSHAPKKLANQDESHAVNKEKIVKAVAVVLPLLVGVAYSLVLLREARLKERVRTPSDEKPVVSRDAEGVALEQDLDRYWGSYRSNLYFGFKTRHPQSPVMGALTRCNIFLCTGALYLRSGVNFQV